MNIAEILEVSTRRLRGAGIVSAKSDARRILNFVLGAENHDPLARLGDDQVATFDKLIDQRQAFRPVSQIVGYRDFWKHRFKITADVLDPRPDSETLVEIALVGLQPMTLLDLGTGSGILAICLLAEWPTAIGIATDLSQAALAIANENARGVGVADRLRFQCSDWFAGIGETFDLIVSNPPYIAESEMNELSADVRLWEPLSALSPGGDGLNAYRIIAAGLSHHLNPGGRALFEIGHRQADAVCQILRDLDLGIVRLHRDINGLPRVVELDTSLV